MIKWTAESISTVRGLLHMPIQLVRYELKEFVLLIDEEEIVHDVYVFEYRTIRNKNGESIEVGQTHLSAVKERNMNELPQKQIEDIQNGIFEWSTPIEFSTVENIESFLEGNESRLINVPPMLEEFM